MCRAERSRDVGRGASRRVAAIAKPREIACACVRVGFGGLIVREYEELPALSNDDGPSRAAEFEVDLGAGASENDVARRVTEFDARGCGWVVVVPAS
jgi:hypothetical protein